jgi:excisionase family DNA binding protein
MAKKKKDDYPPPWMTMAQCAHDLDVDLSTIRRYIQQGRLKAVRVGPQMIRVERASFLEMTQPVGGGSE